MTKTKLQVMREKKSEGKMIKFEVVEADVIENTITLDAGDYFKNGQIITLNEKMILLESKPDIPINKYEEDLAKASEILNKAHLPKIIDIAVNAIDDAIVDIDMEAEQEWHAKITLESSLIEIAEQIENQPKLSIPKKIAEELDGFNPNECETKIELLIVGYYKSFLSDELMSFCLANNGLNLCAFYLAGKALGVELVEVTDE